MNVASSDTKIRTKLSDIPEEIILLINKRSRIAEIIKRKWHNFILIKASSCVLYHAW